MAESDPTQTGGQEEEQLSPEELIAQKVHAEQSAEFNQFDEDTGEVVPKEDAPEAPEPPQTAAEVDAVHDAVVEAGAPPAPTTHKVKVFGQEEEVPLEDLIRNYQKGRAADIKLQNAARLEREWQEANARIQQGRPSQDAGNQQPPSQDAAQENGLNSPVVKAQIKSEILAEIEMQRQVNTFKQEFPEIANDPDLWNAAIRLEQERLETAAALGEPLGDALDAYRKHGEQIRKKFKLTVAEPTTDKLERKKTITAVPSAGARAPTPQPEKPLTVSQQIEQERQARIKGPIR